ncbi:MAG: EAL domain-containing protein [Cyanobacteria bacterium P01_A01_bin.70]
MYASLFGDCGDAIVIADQQSKILFANEKAQSLFAAHPSVLLQPLSDTKHTVSVVNEPEGAACYPLQEVLTGANFCDRECLLQSSTAAPPTWLSITGYAIHLPEPPHHGALLLVRDITAQKASAVDPAPSHTRGWQGLVDRTAFMARIAAALADAQQQQTSVAVLCLDVKRLKAVNDTFGYLAGDRLLIEIADRLICLLRPSDTLSRLGGDEFTLLIEKVDKTDNVVAFVAAIHTALAPPFQVQGHDINIDVNVGIGFSQGTTPDADTLLRQADIAMNRAKHSFGADYCVFETFMQADADDSLHLEMALKRAIARQEFFLEYQPIFWVRTQAIIGVESLVRWHHPEQGVLPPAKFIPVAEKTGLIIPLGWWILEESCRQLKAWQDTLTNAEKLFVSVNMSSKQFAQTDVLDRIKGILKTTGLAATALKIEITESVLIENSSSIIEILQAIRDLGIKLSVDDFGTGYSSLSYLHKFPVDTLKIDRSFLENADSDFEKLEILQSMVHLAWNLGLEVVAEGIETPRHFAQIKALRCESGQGFLFSEPLGTEAFEEILRSQTDL